MNKADIKILTNRKQYLKWPFGLSFKEKIIFVMKQQLSKKTNVEQILTKQFTLEQAYWIKVKY